MRLLRRAPRPAAAVAILALGCRAPPRAPDHSDTGLPARPAPSVALDSAASPDSLLARGERMYLRGEYDSARAVWSALLERSRAKRDSVTEARVLTWLGLAAWRLGDYREAQRLGELALALKQRWALQADLFKSYNALGLLAWNEGRFGEATDLFGRASAAAQAAGDRRGMAAASGNLALVLTELGEFDEARRGFDSARAGGHALGDARVEGNALNNLAMLDIRVGASQAAIPRLREARRLYASIGYATGEQQALGQLGTAYAALGEPRLAMAALDSALALSRSEGLRQEEASNLEALAELHHEAGDLPRALSLYSEAAAINRELGLQVEAGADARSEAEIQSGLGLADRARELGMDALRIHRDAGARFEELTDLLFLAEAADLAAERDAADRRLAEARALAGRIGVGRVKADLALTTARIADRHGDAPGVLRALRGVAGDFAESGYGFEQEALRLEMRALSRLGRMDAAAEVGRQAVAALERARGRYGSGMLRTSYLAANRGAYADLVEVLRRLGRTEEAMEVADAARGRAFLESLAGARAGDRAASVFEHQLAQGEQLLLRVDTLADQLAALEQGPNADPPGRAQAAFIRARLDTARAEYEALAVRLAEARSPQAAVAGVAATGARELRGRLAADEALLEYLCADDTLFVFAMRRDGLSGMAVGISPGRIAARVRLARGLLVRDRGGPPGDVAALDSLHELLVGPVLRAGALVGIRRLLIVPHGVLSYLPFAALRNPATGRYLAQDFTLVTVPSAAALAVWREPRGSARGEGPAPGAPSAVLAPQVRELPATGPEAAAIARAVRGAAVLEGSRATERAARQALEADAVVHFATHAELNPLSPFFSRIDLARGRDPEAKSDDDGRLDVHEVLGLRIRSDLVFLSGCETALGASAVSGLVPGEDYATLARAFLYAGARNVIATLWRVEDRGAAEFAARFYRHFPGVPAAEALALAQRDMLAEPKWRAPYYWAGYVLSGDGGTGPRAQKGGGLSVR